MQLIKEKKLHKRNIGAPPSEYEYGALGEVVTEKRTLKQSSGNTKARTAVMAYQSDYLGRMQYIDYPDGERITYSYDYGGNVNSVTGRKQQNGLSGTYPYIKDIGYDEYGQRTYIKYGNNVETTYVYDANRRWLSSINTKSNYGTLQNISYSFDRVGNVLGYTNASGNYSTSQDYSYDDLYQLTRATGTTNGATISNQSYTASYTQKFTFDKQGLGNMTKKESSQASNRSFIIGDDLNYTYDYVYESGFVHRAKQIGANYYKYDLNGNVTAVQGTPFNAAQSQDREVTQIDENTYTTDYGWGLEEDGFGRASSDAQKKLGRTYTWNEKNELSGSADSKYNVSYVYGEGGERTAKIAHSSTGTTRETLYFNRMYSWHYDGAISDYTGNYSKNIFLGETRILTKVNRADTFTAEEYGKQYWYHSDHLGSASLITDYQGKEYERIEYTPYGELWVERKTPVDNLDTLFRFTGKELDVETGNYYYGARYLDPRTSRWLSTDPAIGEYVPSAPVNDDVRKRNGNLPGMGGVFNVVNFHLYHYAGNNPVKYTDPDGKWINILPSIYKMQTVTDANLNGNGTSSGALISEEGCALIGMANLLSAASGLVSHFLYDIPPSTLNENTSNFGKGSGDLNFVATAKGMNLSAVRSPIGDSETAQSMLVKANNSEKSTYALAQIPITVKDGKGGYKDINHWVGINGSLTDLNKDGEQWLRVSPTSQFDNQNRADKNTNWQKGDNGYMYVKLSAVQGAVVVE